MTNESKRSQFNLWWGKFGRDTMEPSHAAWIAWLERDRLAEVAAAPEAMAQLGLFIVVLFKKKQDRRVVLSVYAPDLERAKHMALGRYMGEWVVERAIAKADPTVFRVHDDAWYVDESEPPMNSGERNG